MLMSVGEAPSAVVVMSWSPSRAMLMPAPPGIGSKQWAAVMTVSSLTRVPPHITCASLMLLMMMMMMMMMMMIVTLKPPPKPCCLPRMTAHGQAPCLATTPPTILPRPLTPHWLGAGAGLLVVVGGGVGAGLGVSVDWKGRLGSAQHRVKSKPSNPHGLWIAWMM